MNTHLPFWKQYFFSFDRHLRQCATKTQREPLLSYGLSPSSIGNVLWVCHRHKTRKRCLCVEKIEGSLVPYSIITQNGSSLLFVLITSPSVLGGYHGNISSNLLWKKNIFSWTLFKNWKNLQKKTLIKCTREPVSWVDRLGPGRELHRDNDWNGTPLVLPSPSEKCGL